MQPSLFTPLTLRGVTLRNRIAVSPMCQYSSRDGFASEWHLVHLGSRAVGGAGLVIAEAAAVEEKGRITANDLGIWKDEHIIELSRIASFIKQQGAAAGIQLAHAGRKSSSKVPWAGGASVPVTEGGWQTEAPSPLPFAPASSVPAELTIPAIRRITQSFVATAKRALLAGFDVVELHAAHGYLIHEFLSPLSNQRTDEYGGKFENRTRLLLETARCVRDVWPENLPLFVRLSATDWAEGGWTVDDSVAVARLLADIGVDVIDCSSGGAVPQQKIVLGPGYQVPFAERIKHEAGVRTAAVGMITEPEQANQIIASGEADLVLLARQLLRDPYWPLHAAKQLGAEAPPPVQYARAF
jgi:2,4-dienoyl-CoA reductase-like NADH-dependent reductase (Old Yellow Enzyme family)